jgi:hypothetical protein
VDQLGPNALGEVLEPGRVADCYLGLLLPPPPAGEPEAGTILIVDPSTLLHSAVPQPAGSLVYELLTGHPEREAGGTDWPERSHHRARRAAPMERAGRRPSAGERRGGRGAARRAGGGAGPVPAAEAVHRDNGGRGAAVGGDRPGPTAAPTAVAPTPTTVPAGPLELATGELRGLAHRGSGRVRLLELGGGARLLRLEDLNVENGPDLHVYLAEAPADADPAQFGRRYVDLGLLKANHGNQNHRLPAGTDPARFRSAVIWCKRFAVGFAVAPLVAA